MKTPAKPPVTLLCVALVGLGSGCGGGSDDTPGSGGDSGAEGCVDIAITPETLGDSQAWYSGRMEELSGALWASDLGVHRSWMAYHWPAPKSSLDTFWDTTPWLVVSTFDPQSGQLIGNDSFNLFPPGSSPSDSEIPSFAGRADGNFAVGYSWFESGIHPQRVAMGKVGTAALDHQVSLPVDGDASLIARQTAAGWDGEAFAIHAYGAPPQFSLWVARVEEAGNVLLPLTEFGVTANTATTIAAHKTSTDPDSGRTYVFDAAGSTILNGHLRDGTRLPGTELGPKSVEPIGVEPAFATNAATSADGQAAWVMWRQNALTKLGWEVLVQQLDLDGNPMTPAASIPPQPLNESDALDRWALLARGKGVLVIAASAYAVYRFDYDGEKLSAPVRIVSTQDIEMDIRNLALLDWNGETWLTYSLLQPVSVLRVLKVKPGCVYPGVPISQ